jgi:oligopeptide/dipeptide ABC transporter ATP-binding protein
MAAELVALDDISVHFNLGGGGFLGGAPRILRAAEQVSFSIAEGETLALVGESGSGKSTLGNVVAGLQTPTSGTMRFRGRPMDREVWAEARRAIQIVFQDPFGALDPRMPVSALIAEPLLIQRTGTSAERRARAAELIEQVGLPRDALNRYPHEFSGGQRQRIAIARALAPRPALIVADEPLSALDVSIQSQVLNLMKELQETHNLSYLFISHDLAVVNHLVDRVAVLYLGRLVEVAPREELFAAPAHPYTRALLDSVPRIGRRRPRGRTIKGEMPSPLKPPPGCVFHPRCPKAQDVCRRVVPALEAKRPRQFAACHFPEPVPSGASSDLVGSLS